MNDPEITRKSPGNHPVITPFSRLITSTLLLLFTFAIGNVWGATETVNKTKDNWTGTSCTLTHSECANGSADSQKDGDASNVTYIKFRTNKNSNTMTFNVVEGYKVTGFYFRAYTNDNTTSAVLTSIQYDADDAIVLNATIPTSASKTEGTTYVYNNTTSEATSSIVLQFDNSGKQIMAVITITYEEIPSGPVDPVFTYTPATYTIGDPALDLSTKVTSTNTTGAITFAVSTADAGTTGVSIADDKNFTATTAGIAKVTVSQAASTGYNAKSQDIEVSVVAPAPAACPEGLSISGTKDYTEGETISLTAALSEGNGEITYTWYKGSIAAGNEVGTGASFSKANCVAGDAGDYFCVASKDACSDAKSTAYAVTVEEKTCPTSGMLYTMTMKSKSLSGVTQNTEVALAGDYATEEGGVSYIGNKNSDTGKAQIKTDGGGIVYFNGNDAYVKIVLDCPLKADDKITFVPGSGTRQVCFTTTNTRTDTYQTSSNTFTVSSAFLATAADPENVTTLYVWRISNSTYLHSLTITRPYNVTFVSDHGTAPTTPTKSLSFTLTELSDASFTHTGWTADKAVKVGGETKTAGTALAVDAIVELTDNTTFTATWEAKVTKHTVTYYNGEATPANKLGEELVVEGSNPTAAEIVVPHKLGYTFAGWSTTYGGAVVPLNTISVAADMPLFAVFNAVNCSAQSGTIFSVILNKPQAENCTIKSGSGYETEADLIKYGTVSGGIALAKNSSTNNHIVITTDPKLRLLGSNGKVHIQFDCVLQEGDKIRTTIENQNIAYTTSDSRSTTNYFEKGTAKELTITKDHVLENASEIYLWAGSANDGKLISLEVIRPEKFAVTFNMHGHGTPVELQSIVSGGKVTEPVTTDITGWDFGGWYKTYVAEPESYSDAWDFANDVVSAATELHAKWTEHVASSDATLSSLTVNGEAITLEDGVFGYAFELPMGTTALPTIVAVPNDSHSKGVSVVQTNIDLATITVTAEDDSFKDYTISFTVATSKDIELVFKTGTNPCVGSASTATQILSNNAAVSTYINQITFTNVEGAGDDGKEGSSLDVGKKAGNMFTLSAKAGYAFQAMNFLAKIQDATCEYSINGGDWTELASTSTSADECYAPFTSGTVHEFRLRSTGAEGVWIRNMQLTIVEACTPIVVAWDEEPVEFEVGKAGYAIAATANNSGAVTYSSTDDAIVDVVAATGELTISGLGSATLKAATAEGDGTTYCANGGNDIEISKAVNTYYLVKFDAQNGAAADEVKYYDGDAAIALPAAPTYVGFDFQGWFDAETGGNKYTAAITPAASMTVYAQWVAQCAGATITTQPTGASYLTGRTAADLVCEATAGNGGALTYEWFTCDDEMRTNPVAATATPSTAVAGTFYYFCKVTEAGCAVEAFSDVVTITVTDKTPICLIATTVTGATAHGAVTGFLGEDRGGSADVNVTDGSYKMDKGKYIGVILPEGYKFQEGDKVVLNVMTVNNATGFTLFDGIGGEKNLIIDTRDGAVPAGANTVVLPAYAGSQSVYVLRENNSTTGNLNSAIDAIAVYRACAPILHKVTVNGVEGKPNALKQIEIEVPFSTSQSQLEAIAFDWVSNDDAWTAFHTGVAANAWEFGVANTVTLTDKDGDESVYTITVNKATASTSVELATLSIDGNAITLVPGQAVYSYEYPYGTAETPAPVVAATAADNAEVGTITQAASKNGTATFTVTAEDGTTYRDYTINISVSRIPAVVIYDGSTMTDIATKTGSDPSSRFSWSMGSNVASTGDNIAGTWQGKNYTHAVRGFKANANANNLVSFVVPEDYMAKVRLVGSTNSSGSERKMFIAKEATNDASKAIENYVITSSTYDAQGFVTDFMLPGTYYLGSTDSYRLFEFSVQLYPIDYSRDVTEGRYGTICLPNGGIMVGAELYEVAYYDGTYKKIFLDEVLNGEMVAGRPYIFLTKEGVDKIAVFYTDEENATAGDYHGLFGSYTKINLAANNHIYILKDNRYYFVDTDNVFCGANRAYFKMGVDGGISGSYVAPAPGRRRTSIGAGAPAVATGVEDVQGDNVQCTKVLINGELFIIRGEKMYDAKGQLVK